MFGPTQKPPTLKSLETKYKRQQTLNTQDFFNYLASYCKTSSSRYLFGSPTQRNLDKLTAITKKYTSPNQVNISETIDRTTQINISKAIQKGVFGDPMTDELAEKIAENLHFFNEPIDKSNIFKAIDKYNTYNTYNSWINASGISEAESKIRQSIIDQGTLIDGKLVIHGNLNLRDCTSLTSLPDNLTVNGNLDLSDCFWLTSLPDNLTVDGNLDLSDCFCLTSLPDNLTVDGNLDLSHCTALTSLPDNLTVDGNLCLELCTSLTSLPDNLTVDGNLDLSHCTSLTSLPDNLTVDGNLYLSHCTSLTYLPDNLTVDGTLRLEGCTSLTSLPDKLTVHGNLDLARCTSLTSLPDNLTVHGNLYLVRCTALTSLPENLTVHRDLDLSDCTSLTSLPEYIFSWSTTQTVIARQTGIPPRLLQNYNNRQHALGYQGAQLEFSINDYRPVSAVDASKLPELVSQLSDSSLDSLNPLWSYASRQIDMTSSWNNLAIFLTRLLNETPRENNQIPKKLKDNLTQLFNKMEDEYKLNSEDLDSCNLINQTLSTAAMAVETCIDRVKVGYLYMQFFTTQSPKTYIDVLNIIQQFVNDVDAKKIIYNTMSKTFQNVHDVAKDDKFSEAKNFLNPSKDSELSVSVRYNLACNIIIHKDATYQALQIGDPIEDILNLAYKHPNILDNDIHKIDMRYRSCCSLTGNILEAALKYVQQHKLDPE